MLIHYGAFNLCTTLPSMASNQFLYDGIQKVIVLQHWIDHSINLCNWIIASNLCGFETIIIIVMSCIPINFPSAVAIFSQKIPLNYFKISIVFVESILSDLTALLELLFWYCLRLFLDARYYYSWAMPKPLCSLYIYTVLYCLYCMIKLLYRSWSWIGENVFTVDNFITKDTRLFTKDKNKFSNSVLLKRILLYVKKHYHCTYLKVPITVDNKIINLVWQPSRIEILHYINLLVS